MKKGKSNGIMLTFWDETRGITQKAHLYFAGRTIINFKKFKLLRLQQKNTASARGEKTSHNAPCFNDGMHGACCCRPS
ncbi:MAG: hypothetical protein R2912_03040 [Eubacteriales bacterium]